MGGSAREMTTSRNAGQPKATALRVCIVNFRTREEDLTALLDEASRIGRDLLAGAITGAAISRRPEPPAGMVAITTGMLATPPSGPASDIARLRGRKVGVDDEERSGQARAVPDDEVTEPLQAERSAVLGEPAHRARGCGQ